MKRARAVRLVRAALERGTEPETAALVAAAVRGVKL